MTDKDQLGLGGRETLSQELAANDRGHLTNEAAALATDFHSRNDSQESRSAPASATAATSKRSAAMDGAPADAVGAEPDPARCTLDLSRSSLKDEANEFESPTDQPYELFPEPESLPADPSTTWTAPSGPDFDRARDVLQAMKRAADESRRRRIELREEEEVREKSADDASTTANHLTRGQQLLKRYKWLHAPRIADEDVDPRNFALWVLSRRSALASSSWRLYRLAASAMIERIPHAFIDDALGTLADTGRVENKARKVYRQTRDKEGDSKRAQRMELAHYKKLRSSLRLMSRKAAVEWLDDWLVAGISTGLRPGEWPLSQLETLVLPNGRLKVWLHVVNANPTMRRGNPTHRTLDISDLRRETLGAIERLVNRSYQWAREGKTVQRQSECAQLLYEVCKVFFPRLEEKYSLFSPRHQFVANMRSIFSPAEVAALSGEIGVETPPQTYQKRRQAWKRLDIKDVPLPIANDVKLAEQLLTMVEEQTEVRELRKAYKDSLSSRSRGEPDEEIELVGGDAPRPARSKAPAPKSSDL